jgi:hypothetical protein
VDIPVNTLMKVLGGNQSPPDGSIVTLVLTDLNRGVSVSHSVTTNSSFAQSGRNCSSDRYASNSAHPGLVKTGDGGEGASLKNSEGDKTSG